jgi:hypothetical protein
MDPALQIAALQAEIAVLRANPPQAQVADPVLLSLMRVSAAGPPPTFKGRTTGIDAHKFMRATVLYFAKADIVSDASRLTAIGTALVDSAAVWWERETKRDAAHVDKINTWAEFVTAFDKRFEIVDLQRILRTNLRALTSGRASDISKYTDSFMEIVAQIDGMSGADQLFQYTVGLPEDVAVHCTTAANITTLEKMVERALRWEATRAASSSASSSRPSARLNEVDGEFVPHGSIPLTVPTREMTESGFVEMFRIFTEAQTAGRGAGGNRGGSFPLKKPRYPLIEGLKGELAASRIKAQVCIRCNKPGHMRGECNNPVDLTSRPPSK